MTLEEQMWEYLTRCNQFRNARQISRKLTISISYTKELLLAYHKQGILEKVVRGKTNFYRIKA